MGVFSFMETFFFISLGITFVLILLLVYHFKQRISTLEQKHDTMFDIVNNIVKQLRNIQMNMQHLGEPSVHQPIYPHFNVIASDPVPVTHQPLDDSSEEDSDDEDTSEEGVDEEDTDDEETDEEDAVEKDEDADEEDAIDENAKPIVVEVDLSPATTLDESSDHIIIHKNDGSVTTIGESSDTPKDIYKKMSMPALKTAVLERGLSSDPSKMKKQELLKLLESTSD